MWILSWRKYALSKFATFVSIIGALVRYAGVMCLCYGVIVAALICIAIGIGLHFCAEAIAKGKEKRKAASVSAPVAPQEVEEQPVAQPAPVVETQPVADDAMVTCAKCGAQMAATKKFCSECGQAMIKEEPKPKKCLRCGTVNESGSKFCSECGYAVK